MKRLFISSTLLLMLALNLLCAARSSEPMNQYLPGKGAVLGHLEIPRLRLSVVVLEGSGESILSVAAGHIEGTSFPGQSGNVGIAAHRDTFFHSLARVRPHDIITVKTINGTFNYAVSRTEVVAPSNVGVLHETTDAELILVTCYPFRYKGPSPKRFIVHAISVLRESSSTSSASPKFGQ